MRLQWHEANVSVIHLANGQTVEAEVNGLNLEGSSGYVFAQGRDIEVERINGTNEWEEVCRSGAEKAAQEYSTVRYCPV